MGKVSRIRESRPTQIVSVTSGKGGVGKTTLSCNLAYELKEKGYEVLLLDGDFGMSNIEVMYKVRPQKTLYHVLHEGASMESVVTNLEPGLDLISGGSGLHEMAKLSHLQKRQIMVEISALENTYDFMIVDTAPGLDDHVLYLNSAAHTISVVLTPDPSSITDSYALIKVLHQKMRIQEFNIVCNMVSSQEDGARLYQKFSDVVQKFLYVRLGYMGSVTKDEELAGCVRNQRLLCRDQKGSPASVSIRDIASKVEHERSGEGRNSGMQVFWGQMMSLAQ